MTDACLVCERLALIRRGENPTFIAELPSGYAVMGDEQFLPGYCLLLSRTHVPELQLLPRDERDAFLRDLGALGEALWRALSPEQLNYAILGNTVPHLHAHVHPRFSSEPEAYRRGPINTYPAEFREAPEHRFDAARHGELQRRIRAVLREPRRA